MRSGFVNAQVTGMGLITESVNAKYKASLAAAAWRRASLRGRLQKEMIDKAREIISMTICANIEMVYIRSLPSFAISFFSRFATM